MFKRRVKALNVISVIMRRKQFPLSKGTNQRNTKTSPWTSLLLLFYPPKNSQLLVGGVILKSMCTRTPTPLFALFAKKKSKTISDLLLPFQQHCVPVVESHHKGLQLVSVHAAGNYLTRVEWWTRVGRFGLLSVTKQDVCIEPWKCLKLCKRKFGKELIQW